MFFFLSDDVRMFCKYQNDGNFHSFIFFKKMRWNIAIFLAHSGEMWNKSTLFASKFVHKYILR